NDALKNLNASLNKNSAPWNSRVFHIGDDNLIVIPAGQVAGIRVGDKFNVYNVEYIWQGTPCESPLLIEKKPPLEPVATIEAVQVEDHATLLSITSASELSLQLGARVEVLELPLLKGEKSRSLARPVRVREITSLPLELPNG